MIHFELHKKYIMGILNVTPDSFYDGGRYVLTDAACARAHTLVEDGAHCIDIGGESTRPGAEPVTLEEELGRVIPVVRRLAKELSVPLSIDTSKAAVARAALDEGAAIINDVSGLNRDRDMAGVIASYNAGAVIMHMRGTPATMQAETSYRNLMDDIADYLTKAVDRACRAGIQKNNIILDPGIGFGKSLEDNYRILNNLTILKEMGFPVLIGLSRKSLIGKLYDNDIDRLPGTIALNSAALLAGAHIVRVHDVREHRLALDVLEMLEENR